MKTLPIAIALAAGLLGAPACIKVQPTPDQVADATKPPVPRDGGPPKSAAAQVGGAQVGGAQVEAVAPPKAPAPRGHAAGAHIEWDGPVQWKTWEEGSALAKAESKPLCLVVYADWCPRCRELAPVFARPDVVALAEKVVMVRHSNDDRAPWLQALNDKYGGYVPRVFFMLPDGTVREDLNSGHPKYPYFFTPASVEALKRGLTTLAGG